jgi:charged multivesicular body protein 4
MSFMAKLFGAGKKGKAPTAQEGIQRLREVEEMLMKKSEFLEKKIESEIATAKKYGTKNKRGK